MSARAPASDEGAVRLRGADLGHARRAVLSGLDLRAESGERILLLGANGSGKSTLIATLAGLLRPVAGTVRVLGLDPVANRRELHRAAGHLGHLDPFYPELSGRENLSLHARLRGLGAAEAERRLAASGLGDAADRPVGAYSHGMRRRLGLAKALLGAPRLLLLDEPDAGLDRTARIDLAARLAGVADATVLAATHHPEEHAAWARRAWVLADGRLAADVRAPGGGLLGEAGLRAARAAAEGTS